MTWRDDQRRVTMPDGRQLIGASFRGVAFFVESSERSGGRRAVVHEFPLRDDPFIEDLGRHARTFRLDAYVLGDNYMAQRDALQAALEDEEGPGQLVHPYFGVKNAICTNMTVRETKADGGIAIFALEFQEAPTQTAVPVAVVDAPAQVAAGADSAITATQAEFEEQYDVERLPPFANEAPSDALTRATEGLAAELAPIVSTTQEAAELRGKVALLTAEASSFVRQPALVLGKFRDMITGLVETSLAAPGSVMNALIAAYSVDLGDPVEPTTSNRARELANQTAMIAGLRRILAVEAARLAPLASYVSIEEATAARDQIGAMLDEQAATADDTAYPAIVDLRSQVMRAVPGGQAFASIVPVAQNEPIPSIALAYRLYGDVDLEEDIIARNRIAHPGFVAGDLKVLSDG